MKHVRRCGSCAALLAAALAVAPAIVVRAQDELGGAKTLYVNASYEEALASLDQQAAVAGASGARTAEINHYRALCFIALGRAADADNAIALSVAADPFAVPDTSELSPRVASVFNAARARLIPEVARAALADGRQLMQKGDAAEANRRFEAVTKLLSDPGLAGRTDLSDLTLAATAFAELTKAQMAAAAVAAAAAAVPAPQPGPPPAGATEPPASAGAGSPGPPPITGTPAPSRTTGTVQFPTTPRSAPAATTLRPPTAASPAAASASIPGFVAAVPISQAVPAWQPGTGIVSQLEFSGAVRVTIDANGKVTDAVMQPSVYPPYDRQILTAAREWTYRPATQNGKPVASERLVEIVLRPRK
jgi:periplasmic protein TonB